MFDPLSSGGRASDVGSLRWSRCDHVPREELDWKLTKDEVDGFTIEVKGEWASPRTGVCQSSSQSKNNEPADNHLTRHGRGTPRDTRRGPRPSHLPSLPPVSSTLGAEVLFLSPILRGSDIDPMN